MQVDAFDHFASGVERVFDAPALDREQALGNLGNAQRITIRHLSPDHALDDAAFADLLAVAVDGLNRGAVAQHGDLVGDLGQFVELVRNDDRSDALSPELDEQTQQSVAVGFVEAGGRLIEDQQLHLLGEGLGDLDKLLLADSQIGDERIRRFLEPDLA